MSNKPEPKRDEKPQSNPSPAAAPEKAAEKPQPSTAAPQPVAVTVTIPTELEPDRQTYWAGLHEDCPMESITCGAVTFHKVTRGMQATDGGAEQALIAHDGGIVRLNDAELKAVQESAARQGIQVNWMQRNGQNGIPEMRHRASLVPLRQGVLAVAWYCYLIPCEPGFVPISKLKALPSPMAARPSNFAQLTAKPKPNLSHQLVTVINSVEADS